MKKLSESCEGAFRTLPVKSEMQKIRSNKALKQGNCQQKLLILDSINHQEL